MNIFLLDTCPVKIAQAHNSKHLVKMVTETCQLLCTAHHIVDKHKHHPHLMKATHHNHPTAQWVRKTVANYQYAYHIFAELANEYSLRYGKEHKSWEVYKDLLKYPPEALNAYGSITPIALAIPDHLKEGVGNDINSRVNAYRSYYKSYKQYWAKRVVKEFFGKTMVKYKLNKYTWGWIILS